MKVFRPLKSCMERLAPLGTQVPLKKLIDCVQSGEFRGRVCHFRTVCRQQNIQAREETKRLLLANIA